MTRTASRIHRAQHHARLVISEAEFLQQVIQAAKLFRWRVYHPWLSKHSQRGWPDLALLRPPRLILAELKAEGGRPTPDQVKWLEELAQVPGIEVGLWRPSDFDAIVDILR